MFYKVILKLAGVNTGRLVINTTIGILGFIDVANKIWVFLKYEKEDYGQTLGTMGCWSRLLFSFPSFRTKSTI